MDKKTDIGSIYRGQDKSIYFHYRKEIFCDYWVFKGVHKELSVMNFMKNCDFYEELRLLRRVVTIIKSCNIHEQLSLLLKDSYFFI